MRGPKLGFHFTLVVLLLTITPCRCAEPDGNLDEGINPHIDDQLYNTVIAHKYIAPFEEYYRLRRGYFTPVIGYTDEGVDRALSHTSAMGTRFTLLPEPGTPGGFVAYSTFVFRNPRTRTWRHAVTIISLTPGMNGELIGEAHFPAGMPMPEVIEMWNRLNELAHWDRRSITSQFGRFALHL